MTGLRVRTIMRKVSSFLLSMTIPTKENWATCWKHWCKKTLS